MSDLVDDLRTTFQDKEYRDSYAESFMGSWIAAQIRVLREQRGLSQQDLAARAGTKQAGISRLENVNHLAWKVQTLARLAKAFDLRLKISFEEFGTLPQEIENFGRNYLRRDSYENDQIFKARSDETSDALSTLSQGELAALGRGKEENEVAISNTRTGFSVLGGGGHEPPREGKSPGFLEGTGQQGLLRAHA